MRRAKKCVLLVSLTVATVIATALPASAGNQVERPYKGSDQVDVLIDFESCTELGCNFTTSGDNGRASHLGKISTSSEGVVQFGGPCELSDGSPGSSFSTEGTFEFVAANGDAVFGTFENAGCADPAGVVPGDIAGSQEILGGTGRFAGATGSALTSGDNIGPLSWVGTLTY